MSQIQDKPYLAIKEISDPIIRRNFQNLFDYFATQNQLLDFVFIEASFTGAENNRKISHGLGFIPKDVIVSRLTGGGSVTFNFGLFDDSTLDVSASGVARVRFFVGARKLASGQTEVQNLTTDTQVYHST